MAGGADLTDILANGKAKEASDPSAVGPAFVGCIGRFCVIIDLLGWYSSITMVVAMPEIMVPITTTRNLPFKRALIFSGYVFL